MKIQKISIRNFKSIESLDFEFTDVTTALVAKNGRGKTAFKEAFYAGITGEFPDNCIRNGEETCSVKMVLDDGTEFERIQNRTKPNKVLIDGKATTAKTLHELITTKTALSKDVLKIVASTDVLQGLQPAEFGKFITAYIPEKLDYATVIGYIPSIPADAEQVLRATLPPMPDTFGIPKLNEAHARFMEDRKLAKRDLAAIEAKIYAFKGSEPARSIKTIDDELSDVMKKEGAQKATKVALNLYNSAVANKKMAEENLAKLSEKITANTSTRPVPAALDAIRTERNAVQKQIVDATTMINIAKDNIAVYQDTIENLNKPVCPISEKLVCTTDKTNIKKDLEELIDANKEGIVIQQGIIKEANAKLAELDEKEKAYRANEMSYNEKVILTKRYEEQKRSIPTLPPKPEDATVVDYAATIAMLKKERDDAIAYQQFEKDKVERDKKANLVTIYEYLCATFNAKGDVMQQITDHYMSLFEATCNTTALDLRPGFEFKFVSDNGISYLIRPSTGKAFTTFSALSSGEKALALFILTDMLSKLTDSKMMILDDLDKLDKEAFDELLALTQSPMVQSEYHHIILAAVNHDDILSTIAKYGIKNVY